MGCDIVLKRNIYLIPSTLVYWSGANNQKKIFFSNLAQAKSIWLGLGKFLYVLIYNENCIFNLKIFCFKSVFGDKLVRNYILESDLFDEALLPSPNQLKYKILIKNKKLNKQTAATAVYNFSSSNANIQMQSSVSGNVQQMFQVQQQLQLPSTPNKKSFKYQSKGIKSASTNNNNNLQSMDDPMFTGSHDEAIDGENPARIDQETAAVVFGSCQTPQPVTSSGMAGMVKRIRTISTRLTTATTEPGFKNSLSSLVHKSKSLTDSAFNKLGKALNKVTSNSTRPLVDSAVVNKAINQAFNNDDEKKLPMTLTSVTSNKNEMTAIYSGGLSGGGGSPTISNATSVADTINGTTLAAVFNKRSDLVDLTYLNRIRKRMNIRNNSLEIQPIQEAHSYLKKKRESSLEVVSTKVQMSMNDLDRGTEVMDGGGGSSRLQNKVMSVSKNGAATRSSMSSILPSSKLFLFF